MVPLDQVKAIIIGQDPAPQPGLATGLAFSLDESVHPTEVPSVQRVILEARNESYCVDPEKGVLISWAEQGVVLLNTALTLIQDEIGSHIDVWANFTDNLIEYINENASLSVWIPWGWNAKQLEDKIDHSKHWARSIQPKFLEISVQNSMDRFGPTGKVSKKQVHLLRWSSFSGRTGLNFG